MNRMRYNEFVAYSTLRYGSASFLCTYMKGDNVARLHRKAYRRWRSSLQQTQQLAQSLVALYQLLRTTQSLDTILQAILETAVRCVPGAQRGSLIVREGEYFRYHATYGYNLEKLKPARFPAEQFLRLLPEGQRRSQNIRYEEWNSTYLDDESYRLLRTYGDIHLIRRSLLSSIFVSGAFFGTLVLDNLHNYATFPPASEATALLLAEQAGVVIEHAQLLDNLRRTNSLLAETEKLASLGRLISGVAHEINNPLTAVLGYTDLLQLEDLSPEAFSAVDQIRLGAERMRSVIRNLQVFARQQRPGHGEVHFSLLINQILALKQADLLIDQITVERELPLDLPMLWGDAGALSQVLLNLVSNAQHALRLNAGERRMRVQAWKSAVEDAPNERITIAVRDNGPGMTPEVLNRIFEPFFTTKPQDQGAGLGLSMCYGIVAAHGGRIWAESEVGAGTTMLLELPVQHATERQAGLGDEEATRRPDGLRLLIVDDDELVVRLVRDALMPQNQLSVARTGHAALNILDHEAFDIILCDLKMPGMRGNEFYRILHDTSPKMVERLLFISGDTSNLGSHDFLDSTQRPLLAKPFTPTELYQAIHQINRAQQ